MIFFSLSKTLAFNLCFSSWGVHMTFTTPSSSDVTVGFSGFPASSPSVSNSIKAVGQGTSSSVSKFFPETLNFTSISLPTSISASFKAGSTSIFVGASYKVFSKNVLVSDSQMPMSSDRNANSKFNPIWPSKPTPLSNFHPNSGFSPISFS